MSLWIAVIAVSIGSYAIRVLPFLVGTRVHLSERAQDGLRHAGMGAITALLVLAIAPLARPGSGLPVLALAAALITSGLCAVLGRSMVITVLAGGAAYGVMIAVAGTGWLGAMLPG